MRVISILFHAYKAYTIGHYLDAEHLHHCKRNLGDCGESPQQHLEDNMTMSAVITLGELLTKCQTIAFILRQVVNSIVRNLLQEFPEPKCRVKGIGIYNLTTYQQTRKRKSNRENREILKTLKD